MKMFDSGTLPIEIPAFQRAQLRSEMLRIMVVIAAVLALLLLQATRMLILHAQEDRMHLAVQSVLALSLILYELFVLRSAQRG